MARPDNGTRQKLIETAKNLIWTSSYGAVSVDDICRTANVKKGSFYHYFPSKQDLALAAMEEYQQWKVEAIMKPVFVLKSILRALRNLRDWGSRGSSSRWHRSPSVLTARISNFF